MGSGSVNSNVLMGKERKKMEVIEILKAFLFGVVEGITEWLPISSTGHMILLNQIMPLDASEEFYSMFEVVIQLGAILAVVVLFWSQIWPFGKKDNKAPLSQSGIGAWIKTDIFKLWFHILVSCVPAAVVGILWNDLFEELFYNYRTVAIMLILFGIAFILIENYHKGKNTRISALGDIGYDTALLIGIFQLIAAVFPGTSRSGATIVGALLIGVSRTVAAEYTFFLAIPVMFGASLLKLVKFGLDFTTGEAVILIVGMAVAFVVSLMVIQFLMGYIKKHDFKVFGYYRIILGAVVLIAGIAGFINA
jgi:undecaprenyl-diphosphatase